MNSSLHRCVLLKGGFQINKISSSSKGKMRLNKVVPLNNKKEKGIFFLSSDYCRGCWPIRTQPDVSAWFLSVPDAPASPGSATHNGGNFSDSFRPLGEKPCSLSRVPLKRKVSKNVEPGGIIPKESWSGESGTVHMYYWLLTGAQTRRHWSSEISLWWCVATKRRQMLHVRTVSAKNHQRQ